MTSLLFCLLGKQNKALHPARDKLPIGMVPIWESILRKQKTLSRSLHSRNTQTRKLGSLKNVPNFFPARIASRASFSAARSRTRKPPPPFKPTSSPSCLTAKDVIAQSQTGSGKTGGFALPILENLLPGKKRHPSPRPRPHSRTCHSSLQSHR